MLTFISKSSSPHCYCSFIVYLVYVVFFLQLIRVIHMSFSPSSLSPFLSLCLRVSHRSTSTTLVLWHWANLSITSAGSNNLFTSFRTLTHRLRVDMISSSASSSCWGPFNKYKMFFIYYYLLYVCLFYVLLLSNWNGHFVFFFVIISYFH